MMHPTLSNLQPDTNAPDATAQAEPANAQQTLPLDNPTPQQTTPTNDFRRRAYIRISPEAIIGLLRAKESLVLDHDGGVRSLTPTLPADTKAIRGWVRAAIGDEGDVCIVVESETFEQVPLGQRLPEINVLITLRTESPPFPVALADEPYSKGELEP